jgi:NADH-quinone oxidoreductase subunit C
MGGEKIMKLDPIQALEEKFGAAVTPQPVFRGEITLVVEAQKIAEVATYLKNTAGLDYLMLSDITAVDYYTPQQPDPEPGRFALCYHLLSLRYNQRLRLKVYWSEGDEPVPSVTPLWAAANWEEREAYDMFGIAFKNHPDLRRLLMPPDWEGYPQRRDYPLGYETVQFSFNFDDIQKHKPYAKE